MKQRLIVVLVLHSVFMHASDSDSPIVLSSRSSSFDQCTDGQDMLIAQSLENIVEKLTVYGLSGQRHTYEMESTIGRNIVYAQSYYHNAAIWFLRVKDADLSRLFADEAVMVKSVNWEFDYVGKEGDGTLRFGVKRNKYS